MKPKNKAHKGHKPQPAAKPARSRAYALYLIASIWLVIAVGNFVLHYTTVAALFALVGVFTLLFAFYADWKETRKKI